MSDYLDHAWHFAHGMANLHGPLVAPPDWEEHVRWHARHNDLAMEEEGEEASEKKEEQGGEEEMGDDEFDEVTNRAMDIGAVLLRSITNSRRKARRREKAAASEDEASEDESTGAGSNDESEVGVADGVGDGESDEDSSTSTTTYIDLKNQMGTVVARGKLVHDHGRFHGETLADGQLGKWSVVEVVTVLKANERLFAQSKYPSGSGGDIEGAFTLGALSVEVGLPMVVIWPMTRTGLTPI